MREFLNGLQEELDTYCRDKNPAPYIVLLVWGIYVFYKVYSKEFIWWNPLQYLDLGIHEIGHWLTVGLGMNVSVAMGTGAQWLLPFGIMVAFLRAREFFGIVFCFSWLALSFQHSAWYCSTATEMGLVIGHIGEGELYHDWNYMLSHLGILDYDFTISQWIWRVALFWDLIFLILGSWLVFKMSTSHSET